MKKLFIILTIAYCFLGYGFSCRKHDRSIVVIEGEGFPSYVKKVYLTEALKWKVFLDSAECINGKFTLKYQNMELFEPFMATLSYIDSNKKKQNFYVRNEILIKQDGKNHSHSGFFLDYGTTHFTYHSFDNVAHLVNVKGGPEQELFQRYDPQDFGYISKEKNEKRDAELEKVTKTIKDNTTSFYLLGKIFQNREQYSKNELVQLITYFNPLVQKSASAQKLKNYIEDSLNAGENTRPLSLTSDKGTKKENINKTAKVNMLVFWASWCGPCRLEIPELKKINEMVTDKEFYMASISTDKDERAWRTALGQEKMKWEQFRLTENEKAKVMANYAFSSIPLVVFTDKNGKELARFSGYSLDHTIGYKKVISDNLHIKID